MCLLNLFIYPIADELALSPEPRRVQLGGTGRVIGQLCVSLEEAEQFFTQALCDRQWSPIYLNEVAVHPPPGEAPCLRIYRHVQYVQAGSGNVWDA